MINKDFLIIGHPRGGTGYSSAIFKTFGFDIGHETVGASGISSWCFTTPDGYNAWTDCSRKSEYTFKWTFKAVRNPLSIINSLIKLESNNMSSNLFEKWSGYELTMKTPLDKATQRYLLWENTIEHFHPYIDFTFRVENQQKDLYDYLKTIKYEPFFHLGESHINEHVVGRNINTRYNSEDKVFTLKDINQKYQEQVYKNIEKYGYSLES